VEGENKCIGREEQKGMMSRIVVLWIAGRVVDSK
jgi:hypothetical protein